MKIRKAKLKDFEQYLKLFKIYRKEAVESFTSGFLFTMLELKKNYEKDLEKDFRKCIRSPQKILYFAEEDKKIMAFIAGSIQTHSSYYKSNKEGHIDSLFIIKEKRGKGISSLLKKELFDWFRNKKLKYAGLEVFEKNIKAQKVYQKWGFKFFSRKMKLKLK